MASAASALAYSCILRLVAGASSEYEASVRAEARASRGSAATNELQLDPSTRLSLREGRIEGSASYSPLLILGGQALDRLTVLHRAGLAAGWSGMRRLQLRMTAQGSYGTNKFLSVQPPGAVGTPESPALQPIPRVATLQLMSVELAFRANASLAPRQQAHLELSGFTNGGATPAARSALPLQRGGRVGLGHAWSLSPRDGFATEFAGTVTDFPAGPLSAVGNLALAWRHAIPPDGQAWVGGGVAATTLGRRPEGPWTGQVVPTALLGLLQPIEGRNLVGSVVLSLAPIIDQLTGTAYQRLDLSASLHLRPGSRWRLAATGSGGFAVSEGRRGDVIAIADLRATWAAGRWTDFAAGVRGLWQRQSQESTSLPPESLREVGFFVSIAARSRGRL